MCGVMLLGIQNNAMADNKDGEIIATLNAINSQEIKEADLALQKNVNADVKDYANMMKDDHNKCLSETEDFAKSNNITPAQTSKVKDLKKDGDKEYAKL
jgi:predicted outer membrane protein